MATVTTRDYSTAVQTTATPILPNGVTAGAVYYRLFNASSTITIWLSRAPNAATQVGANAAGSYPLPPGQYELFTTPQAIPGNALWAAAPAGVAQLTVEIG